MYNLFISHSWTYPEAYGGLKKLLESGGIEYKDYSVPKNDPIHNANNDKELYEAIKKQIAPASVVLIMAGVYSTYSKWINHEIDIAKNGFATVKPIIAIEPWGSEKTSSVVKNAADRVVKWQAKSIADAIKDLTK